MLPFQRNEMGHNICDIMFFWTWSYSPWTCFTGVYLKGIYKGQLGLVGTILTVLNAAPWVFLFQMLTLRLLFSSRASENFGFISTGFISAGAVCVCVCVCALTGVQTIHWLTLNCYWTPSRVNSSAQPLSQPDNRFLSVQSVCLVPFLHSFAVNTLKGKNPFMAHCCLVGQVLRSQKGLFLFD